MDLLVEMFPYIIGGWGIGLTIVSGWLLYIQHGLIVKINRNGRSTDAKDFNILLTYASMSLIVVLLNYTYHVINWEYLVVFTTCPLAIYTLFIIHVFEKLHNLKRLVDRSSQHTSTCGAVDQIQLIPKTPHVL